MTLFMTLLSTHVSRNPRLFQCLNLRYCKRLYKLPVIDIFVGCIRVLCTVRQE